MKAKACGRAHASPIGLEQGGFARRYTRHREHMKASPIRAVRTTSEKSYRSCVLSHRVRRLGSRGPVC